MRERKDELRARYLRERKDLSAAARKDIDCGVAAGVLQWEMYLQARVVFLYVATPEEIGTAAMLSDALARGKTVCVPRCAAGGAMSARRIASWDDLRSRGAFGILEPDKHAQVIEPGEIDLVLVPALCCDRKGCRLGYGGGYYDRFLPQTTACKAALCAASRVVDRLPCEEHDVRCHFIITEKELVHVS